MDNHARERCHDGSDLSIRDPGLRAALVPQDQVESIWPHVVGHVGEAIKHGAADQYDVADARENAKAGIWQLWIVVAPGELRGVALTCIEEFPRGRQLFVPLAGGVDSGPAIRALWPEIRAWARATGCNEVRFFGRRGWARSGKLPAGWRHVSDVVAVPVED